MKKAIVSFAVAVAIVASAAADDGRVEAPFKVEAKRGDSLVAVRDRVRALPDDVRRRGVEVILEPGDYFLSDGFSLSSADGFRIVKKDAAR